ncbi:uncharacterized protein LODBEIA_P56570 [Lodderomyces beijingensis]|uniref:Ubiquitin-like domain-containing protein n=1 Tax=Lodderomyces beijingensis TaxID=1775926 RepID=A0ABP0ZUW1_9ASCO
MTSIVDAIDPAKQFVSTFVELMGLSKDAAPSQFYSTSDYNKLPSLGPSLPKFSYKFPHSSQAPAAAAAVHNTSPINLNFKSIKPPHKFSASLQVPANFTIYKVKQLLIHSVETLRNARLDPSGVKLMVKSKVLSDTTTLASLLSSDDQAELSFSCLVVSSGSANTTTKAPVAGKSEEQDPEQDLEDGAGPSSIISSATWSKIAGLLSGDVKDPSRVEAILEGFKKSV